MQDSEDELVDDEVERSTSLHTSPPRKKMGRPPKWDGATRSERMKNKRAFKRRSKEVAAQVEHSPLDDLVPPSNLKPNNSHAFRYDSADVSMYLAKVVFGCEMDYLTAAKHLRPTEGFEELQRIAIQLRQNDHVQRAMDHLLKQAGMDDASRDEFVKVQWQWFRGEDKELRLQAARILSKIFFDREGKVEQPQPLKMEGFAEGMKQMLGDVTPQVGREDDEIIPTDNAMVLLPGRSE